MDLVIEIALGVLKVAFFIMAIFGLVIIILLIVRLVRLRRQNAAGAFVSAEDLFALSSLATEWSLSGESALAKALSDQLEHSQIVKIDFHTCGFFAFFKVDPAFRILNPELQDLHVSRVYGLDEMGQSVLSFELRLDEGALHSMVATSYLGDEWPEGKLRLSYSGKETGASARFADNGNPTFFDAFAFQGPLRIARDGQGKDDGPAMRELVFPLRYPDIVIAIEALEEDQQVLCLDGNRTVRADILIEVSSRRSWMRNRVSATLGELYALGDALVAHSYEYDQAHSVRFGSVRDESGSFFEPSMRLDMLAADVRGHVDIRITMHAPDNPDPEAVCRTLVSTEIGALERFGRAVRNLANRGQALACSLHDRLYYEDEGIHG